MTSIDKYIEVLRNPTIKDIDSLVEELRKTIEKYDKLFVDLTLKCNDHIRDNAGISIVEVLAVTQGMQTLQQNTSLIQYKITELLKCRRELSESQYSDIVCGMCNLEARGLQIPDTPIKVCIKCIYSTVQEHQTKKIWIKDNEKQTDSRTS